MDDRRSGPRRCPQPGQPGPLAGNACGDITNRITDQRAVNGTSPLDQVDRFRRNGHDPLCGRTATLHFGDDHDADSGEPLHSSHRPSRSFRQPGLLTPEPELSPRSDRQVIRAQRQPGQTSGGPTTDRARQPAVELPPHTVRDRAGRKGLFGAPEPHLFFAVLSLGDNPDPSTADPSTSQGPDELIGQRAGNKGRLINPLHRRIQFDRDFEISGRIFGLWRSMVDTLGPPMSSGSDRSEPGHDIVRRQAGEVAQLLQPKTVQHIDQVLEFGSQRAWLSFGHKRRDRKRRKKRGARTSWDHSGTISLGDHCGPHRGEAAIGGADVHRGPTFERLGHDRRDPVAHRLVAAEIAARASGQKRTDTGPINLDPRREIL